MGFKRITTVLMQILALILVLKGASAEDVTVIGSIKHILKQEKVDSSQKLIESSKLPNKKIIQLLQIQLSDEANDLLAKRAQDAFTHTHQFSLTSQNDESTSIAQKVQLGMNNVPVLDQGIHGTCVTFAVTGALDAVMGQSDYISQLCNLQLGSYLEKHGYGMSGWNGSHAISVINQIEQFGIVTKKKQKSVGCGGMTQYPTNKSHSRNSFMEPEQYRAISELIFGKFVSWADVFQKYEPAKTLNEVKQALHSGDRLIFAVLLPRTDLGFVGALGKHKTWIYKDSWVLTPKILEGIDSIEAAHEMIITGYDDNATATDDK
ncbi:peptidase C1 [Legionella antarctica]|uniref:Peptidase C1 n=1 Tax=Legionella antarctica TaxID=2708020 RepID=A0A6F8TAV8_9GAMM|nr:peptidase C1 [Legionella antarctica]BCA97116.1 peptidase C1 [Legionella antarctica]